jgi:hypothetical protein
MPKVHCLYCGADRPSILSLTNATCSKNPNGKHHVPYEGSEKSKYNCKYCGTDRPSILSLTNASCSKNPNGKHHIPAM